MNWEQVLTALGATGVVSAIVAFITQRQTREFDHTLKTQEEETRSLLETRLTLAMGLRETRLPPFIELWKLTGAFPRWPRDNTLTYSKLVEFSEGLRHWYFNTGGWLLSTESREAYGHVQEAIWHEKTGVFATRTGEQAKSPSSPLAPKDYDSVMDRCSALRTALTEDLESRRPGPIARELSLTGTG